MINTGLVNAGTPGIRLTGVIVGRTGARIVEEIGVAIVGHTDGGSGSTAGGNTGVIGSSIAGGDTGAGAASADTSAAGCVGVSTDIGGAPPKEAVRAIAGGRAREAHTGIAAPPRREAITVGAGVAMHTVVNAAPSMGLLRDGGWGRTVTPMTAEAATVRRPLEGAFSQAGLRRLVTGDRTADPGTTDIRPLIIAVTRTMGRRRLPCRRRRRARRFARQGLPTLAGLAFA